MVIAVKASQLRASIASTQESMSFHERPYRVLGADRFAKAVSDEIREESIRNIYTRVAPVGSIDHFADSTNLLMRAEPTYSPSRVV